MKIFTFPLLVDVLIWLVLVVCTALIAAVDTALSRLRVKELVDSDEALAPNIHLWFRKGTAIRTAVFLWHAVFLMATTSITVLSARTLWAHHERGGQLVFVQSAALFAGIISAELIARLIGARCAPQVALRFMRVLNWVAVFALPLSLLFMKTAETVVRLIGFPRQGPHPFAAEEAERAAALSDMGDRNKALQADERAMIRSIFAFGETVVREIMTPRTQITALSYDITLAAAVTHALETGHSRFPVYKGDVDHIVGIFYLRDILPYWQHELTLALPLLIDVVRKPFFVPETKRVNELLNEFRSSRMQIAIVIDEFGGSSGLVTIEDLLEEIVGEIHGEYGVEKHVPYEQVSDHTFRLDASLPVFDVNVLLGISIPEDRHYDTLAGYIMYTLGHLPVTGETIQRLGYTITISTMQHRRIMTVNIERQAAADG